MATTVAQHTFTEDAQVRFSSHSGRYSQLVIGQVGSEDFGGGELLIQTRTLSGGVHTVRTISAGEFTSLIDKTIRLELPDGAGIFISLADSTSPDLYVEHRNQKDR